MAAQQYAQQQQQQYSQSPQYTPVAAAQQPYPPAAYSNAAAPSNDPAEMLLLQFPSTAKLTRDDLEEALRSPAYFDALFGTLPQAKAMYDEHEQHLVRNEQATAANMALKEQHQALKADSQAAFDDARRLQERWHQHTVLQQAEAYQRFTPQRQLMRLRQALGDHDRLSESLISSLLDGKLAPDDFAKQFREVRKLWYRRQLQTDKWLKGQVDWRD